MTAPSRNSPCPCGSGKRYKHCCGEEKHVAPPPAKPPYEYANQHPAEQPPNLALARFAAAPGPAGRAIAERIIAAYRHSNEATRDSARQTDLWTDIVDVHLKRLTDCLQSGDPAELAAILSKFGAEYTWFGGITTGIDGYNHWDRSEQAIAYSYHDKLVCLAEALGALPAENPEQGLDGNWGTNIRRAPDEVVRLIEQRLGIGILPPLGILPVVGLKAGQGALHYRHINALYSAARIRELAAPPDAIVEFGGGIGLVPLYLHRFGFRDYTLVDLPIVNVLSSYMLMSALGEDAVCLEGEPAAPGRIKVRCGANFRLAAPAGFALAFNQDSFPEIGEDIVRGYLGDIARTTTRHFLSINHEAQNAIPGGARHLRVPALLDGDPRFTRLYRMPYWLRRGYVEELYRINR